MNFEEIKSPTMQASVQLLSDSKAIPCEGLSAESHRVELAIVGDSKERWLAVLNVRGDLPWYGGERRDVDVKVMSDNFRELLDEAGMELIVFRGSELIGYMSLKQL